MALIPGSVSISGFVAPTDSADTFPSHSEEYGRGGYRTVATLAERNAIPTARRKSGMRVHVADENRTYILAANLTAWALVPEDRIELGSIVVQAPGFRDQSFVASADTNDARVAAFTLALAAVPHGGKIVLKTGSYILSSSLILMSTHTEWKLQFEQGAWLAYEDENDAGDSWFAYEGDERRGEDFGIFHEPTGLIDQQQRIQAALFSMAPTNDPNEGCYEYPDIISRRGKLLLNNGDYPISRSIYFTSNQQVLCRERGAVLIQMPSFGLGNPASEVFSLHMVRGTQSGVPTSQFSFACIVDRIAFTQIDPGGKGSYLLMGGAQGSKINDIYISGHNKRGIVYHIQSAYFEIGRLWLVGDNENQTGPLLEIDNCQSFKIDLLSIEILNNFTAASSNRKTYLHDRLGPNPQTTNLMGVCITSCKAFHIASISGEQISTLLRVRGCFDFFVGPVSVSQATSNGVGEEMVSIGACQQYTIGPFVGNYFDKLWAIYDDGTPQQLVARCLSGNSPDARVAAITVGHGLGIVDGSLQFPGGLSVNGLSFDRSTPPADPVNGDTPSAKTWDISPDGAPGQNSLIFQSLNKDRTGTSIPFVLLPPGGGVSGVPAGYNVVLDYDAIWGVHVGKRFNVGTDANPGEIRINGLNVVGPRLPAIPDSADPTTNAILAAMRAHGLIAT